jgi:hypothetical protein
MPSAAPFHPLHSADAKINCLGVKQLTHLLGSRRHISPRCPELKFGASVHESAMLRIKVWNLPRVELEQRAREARLTLEQLERLLVPRDRELHFRLWRLVAFSVYRARRKGTGLETN